MRFDILTLFPGMFDGFISESILGNACQQGLISFRLINIRDFAAGKHKVTDDYSFGGGCGMVMKAEPIALAIEASVSNAGCMRPRVILTSPQGRQFTQADAVRLTGYDHLIIVCGHYEGVDERVSALVDEEISVGDFVLTGGEVPAMAIVDAVSRMIPGVLGHEMSAPSDSFFSGLLDYPHYTRPRVWRGLAVPEVLLSGDHERIRVFRRKLALERTRDRRPDLIERAELNEEDRRMLYGEPKARNKRRPAPKDDVKSD